MKTTEDISFFRFVPTNGVNYFLKEHTYLLNFCTIELIQKNMSIISLDPLSVSYLSFYEICIKKNL